MNTSQVFYGVRDNATAEYVSDNLGEETIVVESRGRSSGYSSEWSESTQPSTGGGRNDSAANATFAFTLAPRVTRFRAISIDLRIDHQPS